MSKATKKMRNSKSKYVLIKKLILHMTTEKITATKRYMHLLVCLSGNDKCTSDIFGDSSQLTNLILDYRATFHMTPAVSDFIPGSLEDTYKHI